MPAMKTSTIQDYKLVAFSVKNKLIVSQITEKKKKSTSTIRIQQLSQHTIHHVFTSLARQEQGNIEEMKNGKLKQEMMKQELEHQECRVP